MVLKMLQLSNNIGLTNILQETLFVGMVIVQAIITTRLMTAVKDAEANQD